MKTKICTSCGRELPLSSFGKNKLHKDGLMYTCKECTNKRRRANYRQRKADEKTKTTAQRNIGVEVKHTTPSKGTESLSGATIQQIVSELKSRKCSGEIYYTQKIVF